MSREKGRIRGLTLYLTLVFLGFIKGEGYILPYYGSVLKLDVTMILFSVKAYSSVFGFVMGVLVPYFIFEVFEGCEGFVVGCFTDDDGEGWFVIGFEMCDDGTV